MTVFAWDFGAWALLTLRSDRANSPALLDVFIPLLVWDAAPAEHPGLLEGTARFTMQTWPLLS